MEVFRVKVRNRDALKRRLREKSVNCCDLWKSVREEK